MGNSLFYHKEHHVALRTLTIFASRSNHSIQVCWALDYVYTTPDRSENGAKK